MVDPKIVIYPFGDKSFTSTLYYGADVRKSLRTLQAESVQCVVTSPPYWGLRDYGTGSWEGGDPECEHDVRRWDGVKQTQGAQSGHASKADKLSRTSCQCGATRVDEQIGLEQTPDDYVASLVEVFRDVRRVLRDDGVLWLNLGDSYAGYHGNSRVPDADAPSNKPGYTENQRSSTVGIGGLKAKDLVGIPWRVAFALQADGWYLRSDVIWSKGSCMPESVTDRPTRSHECIFLLTKNRTYFYDADAVKEPFTSADEHSKRKVVYSAHGDGETSRGRGAGHNMLGVPSNGRNRRTVWSINSKPYKGAHFATMPTALAEVCIKAGTRPGDTVLDPFSGSGTTGYVSNRLGRNYVGTDLNPDYLPLAEARLLGMDPPEDEDAVESGDVGLPSALELFSS